MATCAAILGETLPEKAGEDSVGFLPALLGEKREKPLREAIVHHSIEGAFAIRQGDWKLCLCPGSGGLSAPKPGAEAADAPPFQLFDLKADRAEKNNVAATRPEIVQHLGAPLKHLIESGRSTPGKHQANAFVKKWPETAWLKTFKE